MYIHQITASGVGLNFHFVRNKVSSSFAYVSSGLASQGFVCLCLPSPRGILGLQMHAFHHQSLYGVRDSNPGLQTSVASMEYPLDHFPSPVVKLFQAQVYWRNEVRQYLHHFQSLSHQPCNCNGLKWCGISAIHVLLQPCDYCYISLDSQNGISTGYAFSDSTDIRKKIFGGKKTKSVLNIYRHFSFIINPCTILYYKYSHCNKYEK